MVAQAENVSIRRQRFGERAGSDKLLPSAEVARQRVVWNQSRQRLAVVVRLDSQFRWKRSCFLLIHHLIPSVRTLHQLRDAQRRAEHGLCA